jgi:hypothetical protein
MGLVVSDDDLTGQTEALSQREECSLDFEEKAEAKIFAALLVRLDLSPALLPCWWNRHPTM